jgi:manganese transport protein
MDPGNWATDLPEEVSLIFLLWVFLMSNLMALLLQSLSAIGIVTQRFSTSLVRPIPFINYILYFLAEIAIAACDLAEVLGMGT